MKPTIGRIVLYRTAAGYDYPAIILAVENPSLPGWEPLPEGNVHLRLFTPPFGFEVEMDALRGVPFYAGGDQVLGELPGDPPPGTWRWPERA